MKNPPPSLPPLAPAAASSRFVPPPCPQVATALLLWICYGGSARQSSRAQKVRWRDRSDGASIGGRAALCDCGDAAQGRRSVRIFGVRGGLSSPPTGGARTRGHATVALGRDRAGGVAAVVTDPSPRWRPSDGDDRGRRHGRPRERLRRVATTPLDGRAAASLRDAVGDLCGLSLWTRALTRCYRRGYGRGRGGNEQGCRLHGRGNRMAAGGRRLRERGYADGRGGRCCGRGCGGRESARATSPDQGETVP